MAVKGVEIENWLSHWLLEKKGITKNSLKRRKTPVLELEENNCQMKLLIPSFWGFESLPGGSPSCQICSSFWQPAQYFWRTLAEIYWQWNSWSFWKRLNLSVLHCHFIGLTVSEVFYGKKIWARHRQCCCNQGMLGVLQGTAICKWSLFTPLPPESCNHVWKQNGREEGKWAKRNYYSEKLIYITWSPVNEEDSNRIIRC